jgi:hypothetical protein
VESIPHENLLPDPVELPDRIQHDAYVRPPRDANTVVLRRY